MRALVRSARLGTLITVSDGIPHASHLPMLLLDDPPPYGTLLCHVARGNGQWRHDGETVLVTFLGTDAYVSPNWYPSKREHGRVVPTWNYTAVHAYGSARIIEDPLELRALVARLTDAHEAPRPAPWSIDDAPEPYIAGQLRGIVGLAIAIRRLEGKWKLSQNHAAADVAGVITGLSGTADERDRETAEQMRVANAARLTPHSPAPRPQRAEGASTEADPD